MNLQLPLDLNIAPTIKVHCIFCAHTVSDGDPDRAHDHMEAHYASRHQPAIDRIVAS